ncbi:MAG TPA: helix-turn-helix transcriptional regulator [Candidatus Tectomicrobia bacterium]
MFITPIQCRAARGLLGLSQAAVAQPAHIAPTTVADFEGGVRVPNVNYLKAICAVLEAAGAELIPDNGGGPGARLRDAPRSRTSDNLAISPEQCRAARAVLNLSQVGLARKAGAGRSTVADFERGARVPGPDQLATLRNVLEGAGIIFIESDGTGGLGVRLRK